MRQTTLIYLHPHFTLPGGAGKFVLETAKRLQERGWRIVVVCGSVSTEYLTAYPNIEFRSAFSPLSSRFVFWLFFPIWQLKIHRILNQYKRKILFPQVFPANWWAFIYKKFHPKTICVWMCHEPSAFIHSAQWIDAIFSPTKRIIARVINPIFKKIDIYLAREADNIFVNSHYMVGMTTNIYGRKELSVIYPGVDLDHFKRQKNIRRKNYIFTINRLTKFKNVDQIVGAFADLRKQGFDIQLKIAGEGEAKIDLKNLVKALQIENNVEFLGRISEKELPKFYQEAKVVICSSTNEPFGIMPIEAMACGTPVIASRSGGPRETIIENQTGLFYEPNNIQDLADRIAVLLRQNTYEQLGAQAAIHAHNNFSWVRTTDRLASELDAYLTV